jgi:hypothetical protein
MRRTELKKRKKGNSFQKFPYKEERDFVAFGGNVGKYFGCLFE